MGTIINVIAIITGGIIGLIFKKGIKKETGEFIEKILGLCVVVIGITQLVALMVYIENGALKTTGSLLLTISLVVGGFIGSSLRLEDRMTNFIKKIEKKYQLGNFSEGFISASVLFCVGAMAIMGSLTDGLLGDSSILTLKATLDGTAAIIFSSTLGIGVLFSAIPVLIYQGLLTIFASSLSNLIYGALLNNICMIGYTIVMVIGLNLMKVTKIKTVDLLPSLLIPIIYAILF